MPAIIALIVYVALFITGTSISHNLPKTTPIPTPISTSIPVQQSETPSPTIIDRKLNKVLKVIDGDTINVEVEGKSQTIRLIGIDSPETVDPRKSVQCYGKEASDKAKELLTGKNVTLESDSTQGDKDKYSRLLRYVFLEDGTDANKLMISEGFAHEYTYQNNPYKYQGEYIKAEQLARENKKGLWTDNACVTPIPTVKPTATQIITSINPTTAIYIKPTIQPVTQPPTSTYTCNCGKACGAMASCEEAYYQLNQCGCSQRDGDSDGVPCESICN